MPAIPRNQCMTCGEWKSVEDLHTQVGYPDPKNKAKKHVTVICTECKDASKRTPAAMPPPFQR